MCENSATKNDTIREKYLKSKQKWCYLKKVPKFGNKKGTIRVKKFKNQIMVPFGQSAKNPKQKRYHLRKVRKFWNKKGTN